MRTKTFLDANVLIAAWMGRSNESSEAMEVLSDPDREFVSSSLLELETVGHAAFSRRLLEVAFYRDFFRNVVTVTATVNEELVAEAMEVARTTDASGIDALHLAAAVTRGAQEFITKEKPGKPIFRETRLRVLPLEAKV